MKEIRYAKVNGESIPVVISDETEALLAAKADGRAIIGLAGVDGNPAEFALERLEDADEEILERAARRHLGLPWTICVTKRLIIREIFADDYEAIWENQVGTGFGTIEKLEAYTKNQYRFYGFGFWALIKQDSRELVGVAGLTIPRDWSGEGSWFSLKLPPPEDQEEPFEDALELGYHLFLPWRRMGYAREACLAILEYGRLQLGVSNYTAWIRKGNLASEKFAESLGFVREGNGGP